MSQDQKTQDINKAIDNKLVFSATDICRLLKINRQTLQAWEKEFPVFFAGQTASGQPIYRQKDVLIISRIKELLAENNLTNAGIKRKIEEEFGLKTDRVTPEKMLAAIIQIKEGLMEILQALEKRKKKG
ncbi:MAG: MerR family transcriptional regulator [Acidobacteriota bacterium]|nr:MerR family transcriptional regulator [Acidobacteriota bacterium]